MTRLGYVDRQMLASWADRLVSKGEFPRLVRQLILETVPDVSWLGMPAGDGVAAGGWDGSVRTVKGNAWVPAGYSVWELSVDRSPGVKADDDYRKRSSTPDGTPLAETTYVEAILRPWTARHSWATGKAAIGTWKGVRGLGLDEIDAWLESAPVTWARLSEDLGLRPFGVRAGQSWWGTWSSQTTPVISPELVLAGRDEQVAAVLDHLNAGVTTVAGPSANDVCAFICGVAAKQEEDGDGRFMARLAVVDDQTAWRRLLGSRLPLVLVALDPKFAREVPVDSAHTVLVPTMADVDADITLANLDAHAVSSSLQAAGIPAHPQADDLGRLARRSLTALRRRLAKKPALIQPPWAAAPVPRTTTAVLMLGSWSDNNEGDRRTAETLSGAPYETFRRACIELSLGEDPLLTQVGNSWHLVSPADAWMLLAASVTIDDLRRLESAVLQVIGEIDPALQLPEESRWWRASAEGKQRLHSPELRKGLSTTLALLGTHGRVTVMDSQTGSDWAIHMVRQLLQAANADSSGHGWQSLAPMLPLLAEAAPDVFADAVTKAVSQQGSPLSSMFAARSEPSFFTSSPHVHLLWALEVLAWSERHFGQAIDLLARLDRLDGDRKGNRPAESLSSIFCPWHPETSVSTDRRLKVLDTLRRRYPETSWPLLISLLPKPHATHFPTKGPDYRDWKPSSWAITRAEYHDTVLEILQRLVNDAGYDASRWIQLLGHYDHLPPKGRVTLMAALAALDASKMIDEHGRTMIWERLHKLLGDHREFATATWALPEGELSQLDALSEVFAPASAVARIAPLFDDHRPYLGEVSRREDYEAYEAALVEHRQQAMSVIVTEAGLQGAVHMARQVKLPWAVGHALGASAKEYDDQVFELLTSSTSSDADLAFAYFQRRFGDESWTWVNDLLSRHSSAPADQRALLLLATRDFPTSWEVASDHEEVSAAFWRRFNYLGLGQEFRHVEFVADSLIKAKRYADVLQFLGLYSRRAPNLDSDYAGLIATGLELLLDDQEQVTASGLQDYDFEHLFGIIEAHVGDLGAGRVASLEWAYVDALGHEPSVPTLSRQLATSPDFFVQLISSVYRGDDESPPADDSDRERRTRVAMNAYSLLKAWDQPPGLVDGVVRLDVLRQWVNEVRDRLTPSGRLPNGLEHLGEALYHSAPGADGVWPGEVVRDFLEEIQDEHVEIGIFLAIVNDRGITGRDLEEGGSKEDALVAKYEADAALLADDSPRSAAILRRVAEDYRQDARRNDISAERHRQGLG